MVLDGPVAPVVVGRITAVYGVRGWVKVLSFTSPPENVFKYQPWWAQNLKGWQKVEVDDFRLHGKIFIAQLAGIDDRDEARLFCGLDLVTESANLPELPVGEFYQWQLIGLAVYTCKANETIRLGVVKDVLETGANDVLVVKGDADSLDRRERLIPYTEQAVLAVDREKARIEVDWEPDF